MPELTNQVTHQVTQQVTNQVTNHQQTMTNQVTHHFRHLIYQPKWKWRRSGKRAKSAEDRAQTLEGAGQVPPATPHRLGVEIPGDPAATETEPTERGSTDPGPAATNGRHTRTGPRPLNNSCGPNTTPTPAVVAVQEGVSEIRATAFQPSIRAGMLSESHA